MYFCVVQSIPFHINYLLTQHDCVIVPGLGAFVISLSDKEITKRWGILSPSVFSLRFNSELKQSDGLLANSIAKEEKSSYPEAGLLIEKYVNDVLQSLNEGKEVKIQWVGSLYLRDDKILFHPARTLSCNASNYGLASISMPGVKELQQKQTNIAPPKKKKKKLWVSFFSR